MRVTLEFIKEHFHKYNARYFYSCLPEPVFELTKGRYLLGQYCYPSERHPHRIRVSAAYEGEPRFFQSIIIHEMIHYYLSYIDDVDTGWACHHGKNFKREAARINKDGWNIQRCADKEDMKLATLIKVPPKPKKNPLVRNILAYANQPPTERELVDIILKSRHPDKPVALWMSYPSIQGLVYSEMAEDDCLLEFRKRRNKAILKAFQLLIDFNHGNSYNLYVLHNDLAHFYQTIGQGALAESEKTQMRLHEGAKPSSAFTVKGKAFVPISEWKCFCIPVEETFSREANNVT